MDKQDDSHNFTEKSLGNAKQDNQESASFKDEKNDNQKNVTKEQSDKNKREKETNEKNTIEDKTEQVAVQDSKIDKELEEIYTRDDGKTPDMSRFDTKNSGGVGRALAILLISLLFLGGVAWTGFFYFQPQDRFSEKRVKFAISGDEQITSGEQVHYRINYQNNQSIPLSRSEIFIRYPEGFEFTRSEPKPTSGNNTWKLGTISERDQGKVDIYGRLEGDVSSKQSLRTFLNYTPANFSSEFQKIQNFSTNIASSPVSLSISGPKNINTAQEGTWVINLTSNQATSSRKLALKLESDKFEVIDSEPKSSSTNKKIWKIDQLNSSKKITIKGKFTGEKNDNKPKKLTAKLYTQNQQDPTETLGYLLAKKSTEINIDQAKFGANLAINGATNDFSVRPGDSLNTSLLVENKSSEPIKNAKVKLSFDAPSNDQSAILKRSILDWRNIQNPGTKNIVGDQINDDIRRGTLTWSSEQVPKLAQLQPNEQVNITFSLPVKNKEQIDLTEFDTYKATVVGDVQYELNNERKTATTDKMNVTINSDTSLQVEDTVTQNDQEKDMHNISWILANSFHKLTDIKITTQVYGDYSWVKEAVNTTTGTAKFDSNSKQIVWTIDSLAEGEKIETLNFALLEENPNPTQTNLTSKVKLEGTDATTGEEIIVTGSEILLNPNSTTSTTRTESQS